MSTVVVLLLVSVLFTVVSVKARAVVPALCSGGLALLLLCSLWTSLPTGVARGLTGVGEAGAAAVSGVVSDPSASSDPSGTSDAPEPADASVGGESK